MIASVLAGITESGILAILAGAAVSLVDRSARVRLDLGPIHADTRVGILLATAAALSLARLALQWVISIIPARIAADTTTRLRRETFSAFTRASWAQQSLDREGHLQDLATSQIVFATAGVLQATMLVTFLMSFVVLVASALLLNVLAAFIVLVTAVALFALLRPMSNLGSRYARASSRASLSYAEGVNESVRLAAETRVFGVDAPQRRWINERVEAVREPFFHMQLLNRLVPGIYQSLIYLLIAAALAGLYASGSGHVASLGAVVLLLVRAGSYGQQIQGSYQFVRQGLPYLERIQQAQQRYLASVPVTGRRRLAAIGEVALSHVSFEYERDRPVLSDISFNVTRRETIGIVGPTGVGKSSLVQILLGLREPTTGRYLINGTAADDFSRADWHRAVSYLPQEPRLLHASVAANIRFFRDLDDDAVIRAAQLAGIHEDVMTWAGGYETIVGPRADAVSGGQQQRICLARALAARPEVLVLDEPTSALDPHTEALIQQSLTALKHHLILFLVAHRMSTLNICDRVMVIVDGRLQAFDTASALANHSAYYRSASELAANSAVSQSRPV